MALDLSNDWQVIDDPQTVTFAAATGTEGSYATSVSVTYAQWEELTEKDFLRLSLRLSAGQRTRWVNLWTAKLQGNVPKKHDKITDAAGVDWIVEEVDYCDLDATGIQRYRCLVQASE